MRPSESLLEPANVYGNQDCWLETTHLIAMSKDPSSLIDGVGLEGLLRVISADVRRRQVLRIMFYGFIFLVLLTYRISSLIQK